MHQNTNKNTNVTKYKMTKRGLNAKRQNTKVAKSKWNKYTNIRKPKYDTMQSN